ncbi:MAG: hypothetical protein MUE85_03125 [Microscillaceae bacterium]|jgi:hypothetical protein|nr:hypothetical protein [Microscillaceae bacterium]
MWQKIANFGVGGLREIGFYQNTNLLLVLSSNGRGLFDCLSGEKIARDYEDYYSEKWDYETGLVEGIGILAGKQVVCGGFEYPDILDKKTTGGDQVLIKELGNNTHILIQNNHSTTYLLTNPYDTERAFGFSRTGETFVFATSADLVICVQKPAI